MKKVLVIILIIILLGAGIGGTTYFYVQNKNQIAANEQLAAQNASVQAQLNAIGAMVEVYETNKKVYSGNEILESDLIAVSVPASTLADSSVTDSSLLIGKHYRVDVNPGTILSTDMLMTEDEDTTAKIPVEITLNSLPVSTVVGDYIDLRFVLPTGEEYIVFNHKQIQRIYNNTTITLHLSEEENAILLSLYSDLGAYSGYCLAYATKYLQPGNDDSVAFYPIQADLETFVLFNPNIEDSSRCINQTLRAHIDEVLFIYSDSDNSSVSSAFISTLSSQLSGQLNAQSSWIDEHTDEDGNLVGETDTTVSTTTSSADVGEAMDSIESSIEDLEAIE
jgi:hypothetical protein